MRILFAGAAGTVTGSKYLVTSGARRLLIDCGLYQGVKDLRLRNWKPLPFSPKELDAVVLTHAHLDHSGYLPLLVKSGYKGPVYCSKATADLCRILLPDAAHLQEEEARFSNKHRLSKHDPALPLYTLEDAEAALRALQPVDFGRELEISRTWRVTLAPVGHIFGASTIRVTDGRTSVLFSGDIGRLDDPLMRAPAPPQEADVLVVESTYGDRQHPATGPKDELADIISRTAARQGVVILPAFAVGRAQTLLLLLEQLLEAGRIPKIPIFLNSPMAVDATGLLCAYMDEHRLPQAQCDRVCGIATYVNSVEESKALNERDGPMIIVSASGMLTGGRVVHHLKRFAPDPRNAIVLTGFQAAGTRGAVVATGAESIRIHGVPVPVRAEVKVMSTLSAHADASEILRWLAPLRGKRRRVLVTHGEPAAADALRWRIEHELGWDAEVPYYLEEVDLG